MWAEDGLVVLEVDGVLDPAVVPDVILAGAEDVLVLHEQFHHLLLMFIGNGGLNRLLQLLAYGVPLLGGVGFGPGRCLRLYLVTWDRRLPSADLAGVHIKIVAHVGGRGHHFPISEGAVIEARVGEGRLEAAPGVDLDERGVKLVVNGGRAFAQHRVALFVHKFHLAFGDALHGWNLLSLNQLHPDVLCCRQLVHPSSFPHVSLEADRV